MDQEDKELLKKSVALLEENNDILRKTQRSASFGRLMTLVYWLVIGGGAIWLYYLIQPYIDQIMITYGGARDTLTNSVSSVNNLSSIVDDFKKLISQ